MKTKRSVTPSSMLFCTAVMLATSTAFGQPPPGYVDWLGEPDSRYFPGRVGETVCGIPPNEAIAYSWTNDSGLWWACGTQRCSFVDERGSVDWSDRGATPSPLDAVAVALSPGQTPILACRYNIGVRAPWGPTHANVYRLCAALQPDDVDLRRYWIPRSLCVDSRCGDDEVVVPSSQQCPEPSSVRVSSTANDSVNRPAGSRPPDVVHHSAGSPTTGPSHSATRNTSPDSIINEVPDAQTPRNDVLSRALSALRRELFATGLRREDAATDSVRSASQLFRGTAADTLSDTRGAVVCGLPADEAVLLTWQNNSGSWSIRTPAVGSRLGSFSTEDRALAGWRYNVTFVCEVEVLVNFQRFTGRLYSLNRKMRQYEQDSTGVYAGENDPRTLIIGVPAATGANPAAIEEALRLDRTARRQLQTWLRTMGFDPGVADGLFGPLTRAAIRRWQAAQGFSSTGYLDATAVAALMAMAKDMAR